MATWGDDPRGCGATDNAGDVWGDQHNGSGSRRRR